MMLKGPTLTSEASSASEETRAHRSSGGLRCHHHLGVRHLVLADRGCGRVAPDPFEGALQLRREYQLIPGHDRPAKARLVDADEKKARPGVGNHVCGDEAQNARRL